MWKKWNRIEEKTNTKRSETNKNSKFKKNCFIVIVHCLISNKHVSGNASNRKRFSIRTFLRWCNNAQCQKRHQKTRRRTELKIIIVTKLSASRVLLLFQTIFGFDISQFSAYNELFIFYIKLASSFVQEERI